MTTSRKPDENDKMRGRELARLRRKVGLSQDQLAVRLNLSAKQIGKCERGESRMSAGRYEAAIAIFRAELGVAIGFSEAQAPFVGPVSARDIVLSVLREFEQSLALCIKRIEEL